MGNARVGRDLLFIPGGLKRPHCVTSGQRPEESEGVSPIAKISNSAWGVRNSKETRKDRVNERGGK